MPPLPDSPIRRRHGPLLFPRQKIPESPQRPGSRPADQRIPKQRHPNRLRPQRRPGHPLLRHLPGSHQTQDHHRSHLSRPTHAPNPETRQNGIPTILRRRLAQNRPGIHRLQRARFPARVARRISSANRHAPLRRPQPPPQFHRPPTTPQPHNHVVGLSQQLPLSSPRSRAISTKSPHPTPSVSITFKPIQNKPLHPPAISITFKKQGGGRISNRLTLCAPSVGFKAVSFGLPSSPPSSTRSQYFARDEGSE